MTPAEFQRHGIRMHGRKHWRAKYAVELGVDPATVWRMSTRKTDITGPVELAVKALVQKHRLLAEVRVSERQARKTEKQATRKRKEKRNELALETSERPDPVQAEDASAGGD